MHKFLLFTLSLLMTIPLMAQRRGSGGGPQNRSGKSGIVGKVIDAETKTPLEYATISVKDHNSKELIAGNITNAEGRFFVEVPFGQYDVTIEYIAYQPILIESIKIDPSKSIARLKRLEMEVEATALTEITVRAERSTMQLSLDKKVFNVGKDLANTNATAADILDNIPSVTVDLDGNVSLRGSSNVRILVDGRQSALTGLSTQDALRSFPSDMIERVEIITNPSARYDAEGMAGIINIILVKGDKRGFNGSINLNTGIPHNHGAAFNLNYRKNKLNWFANIGVNFREAIGGGKSYQETYRQDTTTYLLQDTKRERGGLRYSTRLGADYHFDRFNQLTGSFLYRYGDNKNESSVTSEDFDFNNDWSHGNLRVDNEKEIEHDLAYTLNYARKFTQKDRKLNVLFEYEESEETEDSDINEYAMDIDGVSNLNETILKQRAINGESLGKYLLQADYVHPFSEKGKFEVGFKGRFRTINNDYLVEELDSLNQWVNLEGISNELDYDENIIAGYFILGDKFKRYSYQVGLRTEYSDVTTKLIQTGESNPRSYLNWFPSAHLGYELLNQNTIQISYSRRIRRPHFRHLTPFYSYTNSRSIWRGNPDLDPEFTDAYEIGHVKYWENISLSSSLYYRHSTGVIQRVFTLEDDIAYSTPQNLSKRDNFGLEFTFNGSVNKWLRLMGSFNFFRSITDGGNIDAGLENDNYSWFSRFSSRIKLPYEIENQIRFNFRAPMETTQGKRKAMYFADLSFSKDVLKGNGTLTFNVRDLFNTRLWRFEVLENDFYQDRDYRHRPRQFTLSFNYRINQKKERGRNRNGVNGNNDGEMEEG